jgi:UrcA family protein
MDSAGDTRRVLKPTDKATMARRRIMQSFINKTVVSIAFGVFSTLALSTNAADAPENTLVLAQGMEAASTHVALGDLNLASAEGQQALHDRISQAARAVCGSTDYRVAGGLRMASNNRACYESAFAQAMSQVGAGRLASTVR